MNYIQKIIQSVDMFQRQHDWLGFPYAVIKKYGDDEAGNQAALLTYYGFLALFPLLLVITTLVGIFASRYSGLQHTVLSGLNNYFPVLGNQLSGHVQTIHKSGLPLLVGLIFTLYGARGVADTFSNGVNHIWQVPKAARLGFPKVVLRSLSLIIVGGAGFLLASVSTGYAAGVGHGILFRALSLVVDIFILFLVFMFLFNTSLPRKISYHDVKWGALVAAIGLVLLQSAGTVLLARELKGLDALYSTFAVALGLLFWIYLQAQVVYYAVEIANVKARCLWPRSMQTNNLTAADKQLLTDNAA